MKTVLKELAFRTADKSWDEFLGQECDKTYFTELDAFVTNEYKERVVFPEQDNIFAAIRYPMKDIKVIILGQDPYHEKGQAMGLSFSVPKGCAIPPSLKNIYTEMSSDVLGGNVPTNGDLTKLCKQGVLMLNTVLTVREHEAFSHANRGWEDFTKNLLTYISEKQSGVLVAILWGAPAGRNRNIFEDACGLGYERFVLQSPHPSPLSAYRGFFGSQPFSKANEILKKYGKKEIDWGILLYGNETNAR